MLLLTLLAVSALAAPAKKAPAKVAAKPPISGWVALPAKAGVPCRGKAGGKEWVVLADLDGNHVPDLARLQQNLQTHRVRLAVWMNGATEPTVLDEKDALQAGNFLRLQVPATRESLKKTPVKISAASLSYGACGVSEWVYQWDENAGKLVATAVVPKNVLEPDAIVVPKRKKHQ